MRAPWKSNCTTTLWSGNGITTLDVVRRHHTFRYRSPEHFAEFFLTHYGPTDRAFAAIDATAQANFSRDLVNLAHRFNRANDGTLVAPAEYPEVVAVRR